MKYELTFLLAEKDGAKSVKDLILSEKGTIEKEEEWGQKRLAYPIKKNQNAYFFYWVIDMSDSRTNDLKKKLNYHEKLIRYLLLKLS